MPSHGALGVTLVCSRIMQAVCMVPIIGLTSNFISQVISSNQTAPQLLVGTLSITCIALLYSVITFILYLDAMLPFLVAAVADGLVLIAFIVIAAVVGQPLTYLNCMAIGDPSADGTIYDFTSALGSSTLTGNAWMGSSKATCLEMKSVWGLSISLCTLFAFSIICVVCLWRRNTTVTSPTKGPEA